VCPNIFLHFAGFLPNPKISSNPSKKRTGGGSLFFFAI